jgi:hypothetical protein
LKLDDFLLLSIELLVEVVGPFFIVNGFLLLSLQNFDSETEATSTSTSKEGLNIFKLSCKFDNGRLADFNLCTVVS